MKPITQLSSRGLRNAPVKKMRSMCRPIAATNSSAAQWWIWRIEQAAADVERDAAASSRSAADICDALQRHVGAVVDDLGPSTPGRRTSGTFPSAG